MPSPPARTLPGSRTRAAVKPRRVSKRRIVVAIAGGSGSGKSWLADQLRKRLGYAVVGVPLDSFYRDRSRVPPVARGRLNFDHPRALDWERIEEVLRALAAGRPATMPVYDFKTHARISRTVRLTPQPVVLVEGLWPLRRRTIRRLVSLSIYLDCPATVRLKRRLARDQAARGRTRSSVRKQFHDCVEPMHSRFVAPQSKAADLIFHGDCGTSDIKRVVARIRELLGGT